MKFRFLPRLSLIIAAVFLLSFCYSVPDEIEAGLTPLEYFQRAQEATDASRYALAIAYYQKFQEQYSEDQHPEERDRYIWSEYEIALLNHKMGKDQVALELFEALLARYQSGEEGLPEGPRILAEKVKARIEEKLASEEPTLKP